MDVLVSGAGIAGLACALEFGTRGHNVTVVERAHHLRLSGTPIDIRGEAIAVAGEMGLWAEIQQRRVRMSERTFFVDGRGELVAPLPLADVSDSEEDIELLRGDLVRILADALPASVDIRFGESVVALADNAEVRFASGQAGRYHLVIGADGQHSMVRRLVCGPDHNFLRHLGVYFALAELPLGAGKLEVNMVHNVPGKMAGVFQYGGNTVAVFQFRSAPVDFDRHDINAQRQILVEAFAGHRSWRIPELLEAARFDPGFYLTDASQVHLPSWHRGRVVLVGDAGYCASFLSGRGTSLALTGARLLAEELGRLRADEPVDGLAAACERYETRLRPHVTHAQGSSESGRARMLPSTWAAIRARNQALQAR